MSAPIDGPFTTGTGTCVGSVADALATAGGGETTARWNAGTL